MVGENFEIQCSQIAQNAFDSSTMVEEIFEIQCSKIAQNAFDSPTMVGENFEIQCSEIAQNAFDLSTWLEKIVQNFVKPISTEISGSTENLSCMDIAR